MSSTVPPTSAGQSAARSDRVATAVPSGAPGKFSLSRLARFGAVCAQLALLTLIVRTFDIESAAFFRVMAVACAGFVLNHFAPMRFRLPVFALVSLAGIYLVLGRTNAIQIVALGLVLIGLAHLPIRFALRVALILAVGAAYAAMRINVLHAPVSNAIWPIFGAMFMFRLIVYMYDLHTHAAPVGLWRTLAYFFMLPNVCFPLFPVVDYKHFCRSYYDQEDTRIYQTGVEWMFRGVVQLLLYRWVYQHMVGPESVVTSLDAAKFIVSAYLMYLKISGSFHVIVGMLHLFGFNLTQANNRYFLSESFTDYWRRINIYWKDFLQKIFFNPIFFRLNKKMNGTAALILATLTAFFVTWALHSYQWFWIRGKFPVVWQDIAFWSIMGLLVLGNMLWENKYGRQRALKKKVSLRSEVMLALRTMGTFIVICFSWVMWSSESIREFGMILGKLVRFDARSLAWIVVSLVALGITTVLVARNERAKMGGGLAKLKKPAPFWGPAYQVAASCVVILFVAYAPLKFHVDPAVSNVVDNLKTSSLNARDKQMLDRGYYEDLTNVVRFNSALGDLYNQKPPNWDRCWALHPIKGFPDYEFMPNKHVWHKGAMMTINRWGMRDRDCELKTPPGTYRIAITGASHTMGTGVEDDQVFDNIVEDRLTSDHASTDHERYELLNFSVSGYGPVQQLADMDKRVFKKFEFSALIYIGIDDIYWVVKDVVDVTTHDLPMPYQHLHDVGSENGLTSKSSYAECTQKLAPHAEELLAWVYGEMVQRCKERGVVPMAAFIPHTMAIEPEVQVRVDRMMQIAHDAGFTVLDLTHAYDGADYPKLWIAPWDSHPNAQCHRMLAQVLYDKLNAAGL
jgi:D-alanyl-lipoteichoic acid acyltransferase DltB (MBOAT superfamily)